ncbi:MAG: glutathione S-transferase family protein [Leptolyngbya sp. SIOISBB]|nr:glutathione S-transferase family protein [Leptolyngbya sp. SIOISBB]
MLTFYYHPLSPIARRVWLALLEKQICFEPQLVDLKARQNFEPDYLAIHPFHHVPAVVDEGLRIIESFAILDYLEVKFPESPLSPTEPAAIAQMKMVQLVVANELMPKLPKLVFLASDDAPTDEAVLQHVETVFTFLAEQLGHANYFGGDRLSLADLTVGAALPLLQRLGVNLQAHPSLAQWCDRVSQRPAWQQTEPNEADLQAWQRWISLMIKRHQRHQAKTPAAR